MDARAFKSAHYLYEQGIPTKLGKLWARIGETLLLHLFYQKKDRTMLNRLGLVIHWFFILMALFLITMALQYYLWLHTMNFPRQPFGELIFQYNLRDGIFYSPIGLIFAPIGWVFNFILTGHRSPLPWVANKETNNGK